MIEDLHISPRYKFHLNLILTLLDQIVLIFLTVFLCEVFSQVCSRKFFRASSSPANLCLTNSAGDLRLIFLWHLKKMPNWACLLCHTKFSWALCFWKYGLGFWNMFQWSLCNQLFQCKPILVHASRGITKKLT